MEFHLFSSYEKERIPDCKEQTKDKKPVYYEPDCVYIPKVDARNNPLKDLLPIKSYVMKGTILGRRSGDDLPIHSPVFGYIAEVDKKMSANGQTVECYVIKNCKRDIYEVKQPLKSASECSTDEIIESIKESGVVGFGGAGFPTFRKFNSGKKVDYLIVNAVECEPYLTTDYVYGVKEIKYLFKALPYLLKVTGAKEISFCTKKDKIALIEACNKGIKEHSELPIKLYAVEDKYPMGYERNLVTVVAKKQYKHIPIEAGCIVDNIFTIIALGRYFTEGRTPDKRCITVSGLVNSPANIVTPYGALASDLIRIAGGYKEKDVVLIHGGPMNGNSLETDDFFTLLPTNGITVLKPIKKREEPCWHCGNCIDNCPMDLQPVQIQMALKRNDIQRMIKLNADMCCSCGLCSYMCPSKIEVSKNVLKAKELVLEELKKEGK